jgi:PilZ domain
MTLPLQVERRVGHRFPFQLPVSIREVASGAEGLGLTQDLSSRGAFFFTDIPLTEGSEIELTLKMPSEITLGQSMRVRCRGQILRVTSASNKSASETKVQAGNLAETHSGASAERKIGAAVCLKRYEYLPEVEEGSTTFNRISALHGHHEDDRPVPPNELSARS